MPGWNRNRSRSWDHPEPPIFGKKVSFLQLAKHSQKKKCCNYVDFPNILKFLYFPHRIQVGNSSHNLRWLVLIVLCGKCT